MSSKEAIVIRHVYFEGLGSFESVLEDHDVVIRYVEAGIDHITSIDPETADLLIVLGGPIGACEDDNYPFLKHELGLLRQRLAAGRPTLGICLGAQMIARALGARVYPAPRKEIGWSRLILTDAGRKSPLRHLETPVLHWHGDTFDLPEGATALASTETCVNQAFSIGSNLLALQFHPEVTAENIEQWLIGHSCEIAGTDGVSVPMLRRDTLRYATALQRQGAECLSEWLHLAFAVEEMTNPRS